MIPIKVCGITNKKNAIDVINLGVSAIGFIFYKKSPRNISLIKAESIIRSLNKEVTKVGVFVNEKLEKINFMIKRLKLNMVQLHGNESPEFCNQINIPVIKAIHISNNFDKSTLKDYCVSAFLFDTYFPNIHGGSGITFSWKLINEINNTYPIILSGGIGLDNIKDAIKLKNISAIDINSKIEKSPGIKDIDKLYLLMNIIKKSENRINIFDSINNNEI